MAAIALVLALACAADPLVAQSSTDSALRVTEVAPRAYMLSGPTGNMLAYVGRNEIFLTGVQASGLTPRVRSTLATLGPAPVRWVILMPTESGRATGDAGWERAGATTIAHEYLRYRLDPRLGVLPPDSSGPHSGEWPTIGFSEVFQIDVEGEEIHAVHQPAGFSNADASVHLENANVLYLGNTFTADGYPAVDLDQGGSVTDMIKTVNPFLGFPVTMRIVPGRGSAVATVQDLRAYRDMLVAVRDRVQALVGKGKTLQEVVAARPTAGFDSKWGSGPVPPRRFVELVYRSLTEKQKTVLESMKPKQKTKRLKK